MATVSDYRRPATVREALELLGRTDAVAVGGGTKVNATRSAGPVLVVDLQALGLDDIDDLGGGVLGFGATASLQDVVDDDRVPAVVREAARRETPSTLRAAATLGGSVAAAEPDSELLAALLVFDAVVHVAAAAGSADVPLPELLADPGRLQGGLVTAVAIETRGDASSSRTGRTEADRAIVAAYARRAPDGRRLLALTGVGPTPVLVPDPAAIAALDPPADFRGSAEYRRALANTLAVRALKGVG